MGNLQGRRSCHGSMYSPVGWLLPHRLTLSLERNSSSPCDPNQGTVLNHTDLIPQNSTCYPRWQVVIRTSCCIACLSVLSVYAEVFWKGCLPGSQGNLCKVCMGGTGEAATKRCADNHNERYYGNMGALRYMVAYMNQSFPLNCC